MLLSNVLEIFIKIMDSAIFTIAKITLKAPYIAGWIDIGMYPRNSSSIAKALKIMDKNDIANAMELKIKGCFFIICSAKASILLYQ